MKNIAAFFDIDGTLYREGLITEVFKKLIKYEIVNPRKWYEEVQPEFRRWDTRKGDYDNYLLKMAGIYVEAVKGLHKSQVEFIARQVVKQKGDRVYTYTRDRIKWHKANGHKIITISGSPIELVKQMAEKYGFDDYRGAKYVFDEVSGIYTGEVVAMWDSVSKDKAIKEMEMKYNLDLNKCYAYGDTAGDLSMLTAVGNPICMNPTKELVNKVLNDDKIKNKVKIVVERKDMIYKLTAECIECNTNGDNSPF